MHVLLALALSFCAPKHGAVVPDDTLQLVVGVTDAWDSKTATLYRFERKAGHAWKRVGKAWAANIGKNGLAAGRGLLDWCGADEERKTESDKKAPAGAFYLGRMYAFGDGLKKSLRGKVAPITGTMACVSDPDSSYYNRIVDTAKVEKDWDWARPLRRPDGIKSRVIVVGLNGAADPEHDPPVGGEGSCVLFHRSRGRHHPTVGCTALPTDDLDALMAWLKPKSRPVYVLMTRSQYEELADEPGSELPSLP